MIYFMGRLSRMCGGGAPVWPYSLAKLLYGLPFAIVGIFISPWAFLPVYAMAEIGKRTGHGRGMSLAELSLNPDSTPEKVEKYTGINKWLLPLAPLYWYKITILWLTQLVLVSGAVVSAAVLGKFYLAGMFFLGSFTKPAAYMLGFNGKLNKFLPNDVVQPTERGEYLTGVFDQITIAIIAIAAIIGCWVPF